MSQRERFEWWQSAVVYEIYVRSFQDTNGDGVGDLPGIIDRLDYLSDVLGVDAIWLTPFYPSPMADFGYDVADHRDVHPLFGDLATFDRLVGAAHDRGLKVITDFVPNHTSDQHVWFVESRASQASALRDWYVWRDPKPDGSPPNNWLSVFGGSAWELDERTGQYYLHSFLKEQPDLNWRNPAVKAAMFDVMRFWLRRGVDGFRVDAAHFIMKDPAERDNPPNRDRVQEAHKPMGAYGAQVHLYDKGHADVHAVFREMRALLDEYEPSRMAVGEIHIFDPRELAAYYGDLDEFHMPLNFGLLKASWTASGVRRVVDGLESALPPGAWPNYVVGNHDDRRVASRLGDEASRQVAVLLLTLRGSPTLYYGDEIGMREVTVPPERQQDPWGFSEPDLSRDGCRTPMQWTSGHTAGFTSSGKPWLPVDAEYTTRNVDRLLREPDSLLNLYRRLLRFRRESAALRTGSYRPMQDEPADCFVFQRVAGDERVQVAVNFSSESRSLAMTQRGGRVILSTHGTREERDADGNLDLAPGEAVVITWPAAS